MTRFLTRDVVGGLAAILLGVLYLGAAMRIRSSALDDSVGPAGMPFAYGWLMVALGAALTVSAIATRVGPIDIAAEWRGQGARLLGAAGLLTIGVVYLLLVGPLGYLLTMALLIMATILYMGERPSLRVALTGLIGAGALWAIFVLILGVSMPQGVLALIAG